MSGVTPGTQRPVSNTGTGVIHRGRHQCFGSFDMNDETQRRAARARKFSRQAPDDRRRALMTATLRCLAEEGAEGASVRRICREAGVSVGLVNHHYHSKEALIADAYEQVSNDLLATLTEAVQAADGDARERLSAFLRASFSSVILDSDLLRAWLSFWSMTHKSELIAAVHDRTYGAYLATLEDLLNGLAMDDSAHRLDPRLATIGLSGMLDALWLEWCLNPRTFTPDEGVRLCEAFLDGLLATGMSAGSR